MDRHRQLDTYAYIILAFRITAWNAVLALSSSSYVPQPPKELIRTNIRFFFQSSTLLQFLPNLCATIYLCAIYVSNSRVGTSCLPLIRAGGLPSTSASPGLSTTRSAVSSKTS